jgi:hypothetical protein
MEVMATFGRLRVPFRKCGLELGAAQKAASMVRLSKSVDYLIDNLFVHYVILSVGTRSRKKWAGCAPPVPDWESRTAPKLILRLVWNPWGFVLVAFSPPTLPQRARKGWGTQCYVLIRVALKWVGHLPLISGMEDISEHRPSIRID